MDRKLRKDGTLPERVYNEFTSEIDLKRPDGVIRSSDVDRYLENALRPLIEEGKAFKYISVNRRTGIRSTRYSYQGGKNIQDSINAVLDNMHSALGYDVDPATGNVRGTSAPPPMAVTNQGRHRYNVIEERILDPRTAASIKAQALRAGGISTTNKATGYTTTIVRPGQSGEKNAMLKLVDETDKKYLAGLLPSSALADGSSPATVEERARAQVARQANIKDARRAAIEDYIRQNPGSQLAIEEAAKLQRVTDRETRARVLAAERTPGTQEFRDAAKRRLDRRAANDDAATEWAKKHKRNPIAKAILKNRRNRTASGRVLNKALSTVRFGALGALMTIVTTAVSTMVKFLSGLPALAEDVRKMANKGAKLGVTNERLKQFQSLEGRLGGLAEGTVGEYLFSVHSKLIDPVTGGDIASTIGKIAPLNSALKNNADLNRRMALYSVGQYTNTDALGIDLLDVVLGTSLQGKTLYGNMEWPDALRYNAQTIGRTFGHEDIIYSILDALQNPGLISADVQQQIRNVAHGKNQIINNESITGGRVFDAIMAAIDGDSKALKPRDTATVVEQKAAEEVAAQWRDLKTALGEISKGILISIVAKLSSILTFVETIARGVLANLPEKQKARFAPILAAWDEKDYLINKAGIGAAEATANYMKDSAIAFAEAHGFATAQSDYIDERGVKHTFQSREHQLEMRLVELEKDFFEQGTGVPAEFLDREEEFWWLMSMVKYWHEKQNEATKLSAMVKSYDTGEKVQYQQRTANGNIVYEDFEYGLGDMVNSTVTTNQAAVSASNAVIKAQSVANAYIEKIVSDNPFLAFYEAKIRNPAIENIRSRIEKGENVTPEDRRQLMMYDNAIAYINKYANNGLTLSGQPLPEGIEDSYKHGEAALSTGRALRSSQEISAQVAYTLDVIRANVDKDMYQNIYRGIIENSIRVSGEITAQDRTITVELIDKATGQRITAPVQGVQNMLSRLDFSNISEAFEAWNPVRK